MGVIFREEEKYKIQAVVDLFTSDDFLFRMNGKTLETLIIQGGMAVDISTDRLATAVADTGSGGTIATTMTRYRDRYKNLDLSDKTRIIGINNLVRANDYEANYRLGEGIHADFIASGAGMNKLVMDRMMDQLSKSPRFWTMPIFSDTGGVVKNIMRNLAFVAVENAEAGGHNGIGLGFLETLTKFASAIKDVYMGENKFISAGRIRTPYDFVNALNHGFHAVQMSTVFLASTEANVDDYFRSLVINAKRGDVGKVPSPAYFSATGFVNEGIMKHVMNGESFDKPSCSNQKGKGCLVDCTGIDVSARAGNISQSVGDYCIKKALWAINPDPSLRKVNYPPLYFCGAEPERAPLKEWANGRASIPAREIIGRFLIGAYDIISSGSYKSEGFDNKITDGHRAFVKDAYRGYVIKGEDAKLTAKILNIS